MKNKKLLLITILMLNCLTGFSQISIDNPKNGFSNYLGEITKIELNDSLSIFHFKKKTNDSISYKLPKKIFIETEIDTSKHFILQVKNADLNKKSTLKEEGEINYRIYFPAINLNAKLVRIMFEQEIKGTWEGQPKTYVPLTPYVEIKTINGIQNSNKPFSKQSFRTALLDAKKQNKKLLLYFTAGWCGPCKWMDKYIFSDNEVNTIIKSNFISIKIDVDSYKGEKLRNIYTGSGIPNFFILNNKGDILKESVGTMKKSEFLEFLIVDPTIKPKKATKTNKSQVSKNVGIGLRLGLVNNNIKKYFNSDSRTGITVDLLYSIDYNRRYLIRSGVGFTSKGIDEMSINYLKIPFEFGYSIYKGSIFNLPGAVRLIGSTYYAFRLNKKGFGISNNDYGVRFAIAPHIGDFNKIEFELYYEHGMKDLFKNINGFQNNRSLGLSLSLTL